MSSSEPPSETHSESTPPDELGGPPRHGFQGDRGQRLAHPAGPTALTIAVSREAGARGGTIARRVGRKLGWQVYNQELLDYIAQEGNFRDNLFATLPPNALQWVEERLQQLAALQLSREPAIVNLVRTLLAVSSQGEVVLLGRGAGCVLPRESTLHVRIIAPLNDRIAYMGQWLRLTIDEAAEQVRLRDRSRGHFIQAHFRRQASDIYQYDLLLNSGLLGEDLCVELIAQAARAKQALLRGVAASTER
jgi:cytidylate kinase